MHLGDNEVAFHCFTISGSFLNAVHGQKLNISSNDNRDLNTFH